MLIKVYAIEKMIFYQLSLFKMIYSSVQSYPRPKLLINHLKNQASLH